MPDEVPVRYAAFGEMAVTVDGVRHAVTRGRDRGVLAVLLAAGGTAVPADRVVAEVWGADAPPTALGLLQVAVSRLRSVLEPGRSARAGSRLVSTAAGYAVVAEPATVDVWAFDAAAASALAADDPAGRLDAATQAEALWVGEPYAECPAPAVVAEADRLRELRLAVAETRARAMLDLGRPDDTALMLSPLVAGQPYREGMWHLLALAQYRSSRQADALATLRTLRARLAEDLGVDPSGPVQRLEQAVLTQDPAIAAPQVPAPAQHVSPAPPPSAAPGRTHVTAAAVAALDAARQEGRTRFVLVSGEAGIGKSRLVADLGDAARARGFDVVVGRCHEGDYAPALWPWISVVRALSGAADAPELAPLLDGRAGSSPEAGAGLRMFDAVADVLAGSARTRPLLLVLEDVHWADATSLLLLRHLATSAPAAPLVVAATRRTADGQTSDDLVETLAALARAGAERLPLDGLDTDTVRTLLTDAVGEHDGRLDERVAEVTGGNPFFVLQYARELQGLPDLDAVAPDALPVPEGVRDVLRQRVQRLPEETVGALAAAAVLGPFVDPDLLAALTDSPVSVVLDRLDLALASGLVEERGAGYAFVHALARDSLYASSSAARRMRLHDAAAGVLEHRLDEDPDTAAAIAHHAHLAAPLGTAQAERAAFWLSRAAALASSRHAHAEALALWDHALADARPGTEATYAARCGRAAALLRLARTAEARAEVQAAAALALDLGRPELVADAVGILNGAGVWSWREHGRRDEAFIALLREAASQVEPRDEARLLAALQMELLYAEDAPAAEEAGARSVEQARLSGDVEVEREVLLLRALSLWGPGSAPARLALLEDVLEMAPSGEGRALVLFRLGGTLFDCGRPDEADAAMAECAEEASTLRHTGVEIPMAWWYVARARDREDPDVLELTRAAAALHRASGYIGTDELEALAAVRLLEPGAPVPEDVVDRTRRLGPAIRAVVAVAVLESGDPDRAREVLGAPPGGGASDYGVLAALCLRVLVLAATGPLDELAETVTRLEPYAGAVAHYGTVDHLGAVDHFLALGHHALGDTERARHEAAAAVELTAATGVLPWHRKALALLEALS